MAIDPDQPSLASESDPNRRLPMTDLTLDQARSKLAGWHFAKESLTDGEAEILYVAEAVLREFDRRSPRGYAR
jgi:hypothetical protein